MEVFISLFFDLKTVRSLSLVRGLLQKDKKKRGSFRMNKNDVVLPQDDEKINQRLFFSKRGLALIQKHDRLNKSIK